MSYLVAIPSIHTAGEPCITPGAMRMRAWRERRRAGFRCYTVEMRETEITRLIELGYPSEKDRDDEDEVLVALYPRSLRARWRASLIHQSHELRRGPRAAQYAHRTTTTTRGQGID